jgi:GntR family transcriptional repressor for pyruvate dehydrogenase complex
MSAVQMGAARRQVSLVDQVAGGLTEQITTGHYEPGAILPAVKDLAEQWQVSRSVIREALSRLSAIGLVASHHGRGVFVAEALPPRRLEFRQHADESNVARIIELRMGIETEAAALAALNRTEEDVVAIHSALTRMAEAIESGNAEAGIEADIDFHCGICTATGNEHFEALFVFLNQFFYQNISMSRQNSASTAGKGGAAQAEHREIFEAILAQDVRRARRAAVFTS